MLLIVMNSQTETVGAIQAPEISKKKPTGKGSALKLSLPELHLSHPAELCLLLITMDNLGPEAGGLISFVFYFYPSWCNPKMLSYLFLVVSNPSWALSELFVHGIPCGSEFHRLITC